jgi:cytochrome c
MFVGAMPFKESKSLFSDELYAITAYILHLIGIIGESDAVDSQTFRRVKMPNRDGFVVFPRNR